MLNNALFAIVEEAGYGAMILGEYLERDQLPASRLTRAELRRQLLTMAHAIGSVPGAARTLLPELPWDAWDKLRRDLAPARHAAAIDDALWFGLRSLVPPTLLWTRVYRKDQPALFACTV